MKGFRQICIVQSNLSVIWYVYLLPLPLAGEGKDGKVRCMTTKEWLSGFAAVLGVDAPSDEQISDLLRLAGEAARASERTAAPVACWLAARAGLSPAEALAVLDKWQESGSQQS